MAPADEGVRVYAQDVLEELIADEYASSHADELEAYDEKLSTTKMPSVPDKTPISPAMDVRPNSRSSLFSAASSDSFWARNATTPRSSGVVKNGSMSERQLARLRAKEDRYNKLNQDYDRNQVQIAEIARRRRDERFNSMYSALLDGMSETGVIDKVDQYLVRAQEAKARKRMDLHSEWTEKVFNPIQTQVQDSVARRSAPDIEARLRSQYNEYLKVTNEKVGVFRDTIIEADYNPLSAQKHTIKYSLRKIEDPLKRDVEKVYKEKMELGLVDMLGQQNLGKHTFDVKWWDKTYATPYGYDVNEDGTVRTFKEDPLAAKNKTSRVAFDHYNAPRGKEVPDMEWETCGPKCRTSFAPGPEQRRNRQNLFETIQQGSNAYHDGRTLGDQWLEYRGKKVPPGPEMRRGRPDLFETFQMGSDPAVDKRSLGDSWLERKGKYMPPGPEQRRNRQDLFETFQEKSNPYQDGRPLGDLWLERKGKGKPVPDHHPVKNTHGFQQTLSHTVKELYDPQRKRRVIPPPQGELQGLLYHKATVARDGPINYRHTQSNVVIGEGADV